MEVPLYIYSSCCSGGSRQVPWNPPLSHKNTLDGSAIELHVNNQVVFSVYYRIARNVRGA